MKKKKQYPLGVVWCYQSSRRVIFAAGYIFLKADGTFPENDGSTKKKATKGNYKMMPWEQIYWGSRIKWLFLGPGVMPSSSIRESICFCKINWSLSQFFDNGPPHLWCRYTNLTQKKYTVAEAWKYQRLIVRVILRMKVSHASPSEKSWSTKVII